MLSQKELRRIAAETVRSMSIDRIQNLGIKKARRYGRFVDKILRMKKFKKSQLTEKELKIVEKLQDPDYGPLVVEKNGNYEVKTKVGECVSLVFSDVEEECKRLANLIMEECWKKGVHVTDITYSSAMAKKHLKLIPFDTAAELPAVSKLFASAFAARIFLGGEEDIFWTKGLESKIKTGAPASEKVRDLISRKKVRWCYFGWPIKKNVYFVDKNFYRKVFLNSINETFSPAVKKYCSYYKKALTGGDRIRITADDGTDLSFRIKGRPVLVADGVMDAMDIKNGDVGLNIPDGEVFLAPLENSANGFIIFDNVAVPGFGLVKNLKMKFRDGRVTWYDSPQKKTFKRFLDSNTGDRDRIAELGIGTNPAARFIGETIVDEKILGSIHIAIGNNTGAYHGKNKASNHQDMIKVMKGKNGRIYVDDKVVMDNGMPV